MSVSPKRRLEDGFKLIRVLITYDEDLHVSLLTDGGYKKREW